MRATHPRSTSRGTAGIPPAPGDSEIRRAPIVVGLDGRQHDADALALVQTLREGAFAGQVVLVHVMPDAPLLGLGMAEFQMASRHAGEQLLAEAAAHVAEPVETEVLNPWPAALALERFAFTRYASLLVLGSSHRTTVGCIVPGSVALRLLKSAPCPVAVAPAGYAESPRDHIKGVGIAYDASSGADRALQAAASAAAALGAPLHVYHVVPSDELDELSRVQMISYGKVILDRAQEQLLPSVNPRLRELSGDPAHSIVDAVRVDNVGLLFAGSRGHGALRQGLFGGVCRALLQTAPCPVVLLPRDARIAAGNTSR